MTSGEIDMNEEIDIQRPRYDKDKVQNSLDFSIIKRKDYTTPFTRKFNGQPRIYATKIDLDQDFGPESFLFSKTKTKDDIFQESQDRVLQHIETIIQSQNDTFNDSFREIDEMSQENEDHLERIEKYLEELKKKILKKRQAYRKPSVNEHNELHKPDSKKSSQRNQRADSLMKLNQEQFK